MCIILDINCLGKLTNPNNEDMAPVRKWLDKKNSKIVIANTDKFKQEWGRINTKQQLEWSRAGKLKIEKNSNKVQDKTDRLRETIKSNDEHIIALAQVTGVNILVSDDKALHQDFTKLVKGGRVYQKATHKHLLHRDMCP